MPPGWDIFAPDTLESCAAAQTWVPTGLKRYSLAQGLPSHPTGPTGWFQNRESFAGLLMVRAYSALLRIAFWAGFCTGASVTSNPFTWVLADSWAPRWYETSGSLCLPEVKKICKCRPPTNYPRRNSQAMPLQSVCGPEWRLKL